MTDITTIVVLLASLFLILAGVLIILQKKRTYYIPEGFVTEYPNSDELKTITNPITKTLKKLTSLSGFFMNIDNWKDVYKTYNMTPVELARMNIEKERNLAEKKSDGKQ